MKAHTLHILHERVLHHVQQHVEGQEPAQHQRREDLRDFAGVATAVALGSGAWVALAAIARLLLGH